MIRVIAIAALCAHAGCLLEFDARLLATDAVPRLATGEAQSCALWIDDVPWCWGSNDGGQLGHDGGDAGPMPIEGVALRSIATGGYEIGHSCGVDEDGAVLCWGTNGDAELGQGTVGGGSPIPSKAALELAATRVAVGTTVSVALDERGRLWTWGWNGDGRLGFGADVGTQSTPRLLEDRHVWITLDYGTRHGCAVDEAGALYCWGEVVSGKLGRDDTDPRPAGVQGGASAWRSVSAGVEHTCAIAREGSLWCWGDDTSGQARGQTGGQTGGQPSTPRRVGDDRDWIAIATGASHSCGLREAGTLWCWGSNEHGQLGVGIIEPREGVVQVGERDDWIELSIAGDHGCARTSDDTVWCWGANAVGQVGAEGYSDTPSPVAILEP